MANLIGKTYVNHEFCPFVLTIERNVSKFVKVIQTIVSC